MICMFVEDTWDTLQRYGPVSIGTSSTDPDSICKEVLSVFPPDDLYMKRLPDCLFEVECGTTDLFEMGIIFLEPNMQLEVLLGLHAKIFPLETIGLEPIFPRTMLPSPDLRHPM